MGLFDKVRTVAQQMSTMLDEAKIRREIDKHEQELIGNPDNVFAMQELSTLYQELGQTAKAVELLLRTARIHRNRQNTDLALGFYRQAERLASSDQRLGILRSLIELYSETKRYEEAYQHIRQAVDKLLAQKEPDSAVAFLEGLPPLGKKDQLYRGELKELIKLAHQGGATEASGSWLLPVAEAEMPSSGSTRSKEKFPEHTLLVVDDDPEMVELLCAMFQQLGCKIITGHNGEEGLARAAEQTPTLIISDLVMPKMDGSQFFTALRKHPTLNEVPFVCLSSRGQEVERLAALARGVEEYWVKPFNPPEILLRLRNLLKRLRPPSDMSGRLSEMSVPELLQYLDAKRKTGILSLRSKPYKAWLSLQDGRVVDATLGDLQGRQVVYKVIYWLIGEFEFRSTLVPSVDTICLSTPSLLSEAMRRFNQAQRVTDALPDPSQIYRCTAELKELVSAEEEFAPNVKKVLTLFDGQRALADCLMDLQGDLETLVLVHSLIEQLLLVPKAE